MYFVEQIVCLFAIYYLNMYVYSLFANIILSDTIYSLKFLPNLFLQHNLHPEIKLQNLWQSTIHLPNIEEMYADQFLNQLMTKYPVQSSNNTTL